MSPYPTSASHNRRWPKWARVLAWAFGGLLVLQIASTITVRALSAKYGGDDALRARIQMRGFATTLAMRKAAGLPYPTSVEGLKSAFKEDYKYLPKFSNAPLSDKLKDPWGRPFEYYSPGVRNKDSYDLFSLGADGREGTADDITNW